MRGTVSGWQTREIGIARPLLDVLICEFHRDVWWGSGRLIVKHKHNGRAHLLPEVPSAGTFDDEYAYNIETDKYNRNWLRLDCPHCGRICSPFMSPFIVMDSYACEWVGLDHKEPTVYYRSRCPGCKQWYRFKTYTPQ